MAKPTNEWIEDDVLALPQGENDAFERKGSQLLDLTLPRVEEAKVRDELAKQLSAFANTQGGRVIYGLTDDGSVDNGGVARCVKGRQSTKEWLESVIPILTDYEILGVNVYEILPKTGDSDIAPGKALYVVDIPDSDRAPHQSKRDLKYYIRLGNTSQPAPHRLIEDIRNRARHPKVEVVDLWISGASADLRSGGSGLTSEFQLNINLRFRLRNTSSIRAANSCVQLNANIAVFPRFSSTDECFLRRGTPDTISLELRNPLYPEIQVEFDCPTQTSGSIEIIPQGERLTVGGSAPEEVVYFVTIFSDSAPATKQEFKLNEIDPRGWLKKFVEQEVQRMRLQERRTAPPAHVGPWS